MSTLVCVFILRDASSHADAGADVVPPLQNRPMARVMDTAKDIIRRALPIKCLEAVFLGLYLTSGGYRWSPQYPIVVPAASTRLPRRVLHC